MKERLAELMDMTVTTCDWRTRHATFNVTFTLTTKLQELDNRRRNTQSASFTDRN